MNGIEFLFYASHFLTNNLSILQKFGISNPARNSNLVFDGNEKEHNSLHKLLPHQRDKAHVQKDACEHWKWH